MADNKMLSLFDYLKRAAGNDLGKEVADYAKVRKAKVGTREVSNPRYTGIVHTYEKPFLDEFFSVKKIFSNEADYTEINTTLEQDSLKEEQQIY